MIDFLRQLWWRIYVMIMKRHSDGELTFKLRKIVPPGQFSTEAATPRQICIIDFAKTGEESLCVRQITDPAHCNSYASMFEGATPRMYSGTACPPNTRPVNY
jgi:hypothetical protein